MDRFAIYYCPESTSELGIAASKWFGRGNETTCNLHERVVEQIEGFSKDQVLEVTRQPAHYGFHATIKPPFRLATGCSLDQLKQELEEFCNVRAPILLPPLKVTQLGKFFCLQPLRECPELEELASACVSYFDKFRSEPHPSEIEKRRSVGLTQRQDELLQQWGYPYVMDEFRFHMTLTKKIDDERQSQIIMRELCQRLPENSLSQLSINRLSLCQESHGQPFKVIQTYGFKDTLRKTQ